MARPCSRPLCAEDAEVLMRFAYDERHVLLDWTTPEIDPNNLELCIGHADRFTPPRGWTVEDLRSAPDGGRRPRGTAPDTLHIPDAAPRPGALDLSAGGSSSGSALVPAGELGPEPMGLAGHLPRTDLPRTIAPIAARPLTT